MFSESLIKAADDEDVNLGAAKLHRSCRDVRRLLIRRHRRRHLYLIFLFHFFSSLSTGRPPLTQRRLTSPPALGKKKV